MAQTVDAWSKNRFPTPSLSSEAGTADTRVPAEQFLRIKGDS